MKTIGSNGAIDKFVQVMLLRRSHAAENFALHIFSEVDLR